VRDAAPAPPASDRRARLSRYINVHARLPGARFKRRRWVRVAEPVVNQSTIARRQEGAGAPAGTGIHLFVVRRR
jgi:hypothetical protein